MPVNLLRRLGPAEREFDDGAWRGGILERLQGRAQDGALGAGVTGLAERPSEGELDGGHPWRADRSRQIGNHRQRDGADARGLDDPLRQPDGPAAYRSDGHEDGDIHRLRFHTIDHRGDARRQELRGIEQVPLKRVVRGRDASDEAGLRELLQPS
jgi:hypothetical protein